MVRGVCCEDSPSLKDLADSSSSFIQVLSPTENKGPCSHTFIHLAKMFQKPLHSSHGARHWGNDTEHNACGFSGVWIWVGITTLTTQWYNIDKLQLCYTGAPSTRSLSNGDFSCQRHWALNSGDIQGSIEPKEGEHIRFRDNSVFGGPKVQKNMAWRGRNQEEASVVANRGKRRTGGEAEGVVAAKMEVLLAVIGYTLLGEDLLSRALTPRGVMV